MRDRIGHPSTGEALCHVIPALKERDNFLCFTMLTTLIQKVNVVFKAHGQAIFLIVLVILLGSISFGLGRLSMVWREKEPITIEKSASTPNPPGVVEAAAITTSATGMKSNTPPPPSSSSEQRAVSSKQTAPPAAPGKFVASKKGTAYHFPWCPGAKQIKAENKIWFQTKSEAEKAGYKPAANCPGL